MNRSSYSGLSIGAITAAPDTTPDAFSFTDITGATTSTQYTSAAITVSGINSPAAISVTGGTYSINGGSYTSSSGTVSNGDTVTVRVTSSGSASTAVNVVLTIGGVSDTYTVTTDSAATARQAIVMGITPLYISSAARTASEIATGIYIREGL